MPSVSLHVTVEIEVDDAVIAQMLDPGWQASFYTFRDRDDCLGYLAWFCGVRNTDVNDLDGWANFTRDQVDVGSVEWEGE